jgi:hypothetical protein
MLVSLCITSDGKVTNTFRMIIHLEKPGERKLYNRKEFRSGNALDIYSGDAQFERRPDHPLPWRFLNFLHFL